TLVQSRRQLLENAMEASLGSTRKITLEASDLERAAPVAPVPPAPPTAQAKEPEKAPSPASFNGADEAEEAPKAARITPEGESPAPAPAPAASQPKNPDERMLEESTGLLAEFFNGQVIEAEGLIGEDNLNPQETQ
ncbi:MAG: hypothetical protein ACKOPT_02565, partial [Cyanobium sp.]